MDLDGVPLSGLMVRQGAGRFELDFSAPNPEQMRLLEASSGAADTELENLANANFSEMRLSGGAAGYELDFGGTFSRDAQATVEAGLSGVEMKIPSLNGGEDRGRDDSRQRGRGRRLHEEGGCLLDRGRDGRKRATPDDPRRGEAGGAAA
jgi:hypothetical protein